MPKRAQWAAAAPAVAMVMLAAPSAHAEGRGDIRVTKTVVDHGTNVIVGTKKVITYPIAITVKDNSGVKGLSHVSTFNRSNLYGFADTIETICRKKSSTRSVCTATMQITPEWIRHSADVNPNSIAGVWQVNATVHANDGDYRISDDIARYKVKRAAKLTTDAGPEPVAKGKTLTVKGKLTRANWRTLTYNGFRGQSVKLQFKKTGSSSYTTVKTVKTGKHGVLSTKVTARAAGTWRWFFPGTTTTAAVRSTGDKVALK